MILTRVCKARELQKKRYEAEVSMKNLPKINSKIEGKILEKFCEIDESGRKLLQSSMQKMQSSIRGMTRILRVARTIADLEDSEKINENHLLEAISYRRKL